jgi:hypothetical protein
MQIEPEDTYNFDQDSCIVYIALQILCSRVDSLVPEILYILSPEQITQFVKVFSGETIKVPTIEDFTKDLSSALAAYHVFIQNKTWDWFSIKYGHNGNDMRIIRHRVIDWYNGLNDAEKRFIERLSLQEKNRQVSKSTTDRLTRTLRREKRFSKRNHPEG